MFGKLAFLFKSKIAIAAVGAVLVAGAGTTAVLAASGVPLPLISQGQGQHADDQHNNHDDGDKNDDQQDMNEAEGTISSIDAGHSSFVLKTAKGATVSVVVDTKTVFDGRAHSFGDLKVGMSVEVHGNHQSDGTLTAARVHGEDNSASDDHSSDGASSGSSTPGTDDHSGASGSSTPGASGSDDSVPHN
jgi:uncharacterized protein DUF5666